MRIPEELVNEIREQVDIVDIVGEYIALEKRGRNHFACCPFHQEDTPSFSVSEEKQIYYCFGCHKGGNAFNFLMEKEGLSFPEAVIKVATYTTIDLSSYENKLANASQSTSAHKPYYEINRFAADYYKYILKTDKGLAGQKYLQNRNISTEMQEQFEIGFAPNEHVLGTIFKENALDVAKAVELGIIFESQDLLQYFDALRDRIVFPIVDNYGNNVAFTGRLITNQSQAPKYYHSQESKIFKKREILYNYYRAQQEIKRAKSVYVCEGIFEVIALYKVGIKNAVATLGTAVTEEQLLFLKQKNIQVIFAFDNDSTGKNATMKSMELAKKHGLSVRTVVFWEYAEKDLDELSQQVSKETMQFLLSKHLNILDYAMLFYKEKYNLENNEDRQLYTKAILELLVNENQATKDFYQEKIINETNYSVKALENLLPKTVNTQDIQYYEDTSFHTDYYPDINQHTNPQTAQYSRQVNCEQLIIKGITQGDAYIQLYQARPILSQNMMFRKIIYELLETKRTHGKLIISEIYEKLTPEEGMFFSMAIYREEPITEEIFNDLLQTLKYEAEERYFSEEAKKSEANLDSKIEQIQNLLDFKIKNNRIKGD